MKDAISLALDESTQLVDPIFVARWEEAAESSE